jgi:beta-glucosidase
LAVMMFELARQTDMRHAIAFRNRLVIGATSCVALAALLGWLHAVPFAAETPATQYPFQNPDLTREERVSDLIGRMTLDEKIDALATRASVPRLGVVGSPHIEGYHGVAQGGPSNWGRRNPTATTQFPQAYGLGSTWDPELVRRVAAQEAQEARYLFQSKKYQRAGLIVRAPNADLARDPRWGRTEEVYGEDPFHVGTLATAFTRGLQGDDPRYWKTAALLKHFLANSNEDARERSSSNFDERLWREYYAKPFEMAVRQGGSRAMMAAYNAVNGIPAHVHPMLKDIVVREWGLDGILCTDGGGLRLLVSDHKAFPDLPTAAAACMKAGINHFLDRQREPVTEAVQKGLLSETQIDEALRGLFRISIRLGLLDPAERVAYAKIGADADPEPWSEPATHNFVREVTRKSIVLLKNSAKLLPLDRSKVKSIAVVGPLANTVLLDWYSGTPPYAVSPREGIERGANPSPSQPGGGPGVNWVGDMSQAAIDTARSREVAVVCVGTHPESNAGWNIVTSPSEGKEGVDRKEITLPHGQEEFVRRVIEANPNTVVVLIASYPVALPWAARNASTILFMTHASQELGSALADVLFGDASPAGRLAQTWPASLEQLPPMMDYDLRHGRTYMYSKVEPQYAFGFGLSYTRFSYANLRTSTQNLRSGATLDVSVDVTNDGQRAGDEVVQLYVRYPDSRVERPRKQLRGFARVALGPGETKTVTTRLAAGDLAYWDVPGRAWVVEAGRVEVMVGPSSADADLKLRRTVSVGPYGENRPIDRRRADR